MADVRGGRSSAASNRARAGAQGEGQKQSPAMKSDTASERRLEAALFTIPLLTYAYFYQGSDQSTAARFDLMRSILERATLWIDGFCGYNTADIIIVGGHYYSVKAPGTSLI